MQSAGGFNFKLNGDTASQLGVVSWTNNSGTQTGNMWGTGASSSSTVLRIKTLGYVDIVPGDVGIDGTAGYGFRTTDFRTPDAAGPALQNEAATSTNPTVLPNVADPDTGVSWVSANIGALVAGGANALNWNSSGNVGIGTTSPAKQLSITKSALATINTLTDGATITPDFDAGQNFSVTLAGNRTLANPTNIDAGQTGSIFITQDGTGSRTLSFGSYWDFAGGTAPTLSTAAASVDRIDYIVRTSTSIHAVATLGLA